MLAFHLSIEKEDQVYQTEDHGNDKKDSAEVSHETDLPLYQMQFKMALAFVTVYAFRLDDVGSLAVDVHLRLLTFAWLDKLRCYP